MLTKTKIIILVISGFLSILFLCGIIWHMMNNHSDKSMNIIILHNNDIHGRFQQTSINGSTCTPKMANSNQCYGGFARIAHILESYRNQSEFYDDAPNVLYFFAGDIFTGTNWFSVFKTQICSEFLNLLKPDAIALGNHEFDLGIGGLITYLNDVEAPIVSANFDSTKIPDFPYDKINNSIILKVKDIQIGVIGYITEMPSTTTSSGPLIITSEIEAINEEAIKLKSQGIKIIIALGHSGYEMDKKIAQTCPDVDLVIGGHSHSFLLSRNDSYGLNSAITENIEGPYPTNIVQDSGKTVPVVQAFAFTKYLGYLNVKINNGKIISVSGAPILLDSTIPENETVLEVIQKYEPKIKELSKVIGFSKKYIDGKRENCRNRECEMGNLLSDAIASFANTIEPNTCVAVVNCGCIRGSIPAGNIKMDIMEIVPFNNSITIANVLGENIILALSQSADLYNLDSGGFLQLSGIKVRYNMSKPLRQRIQHRPLIKNCSKHNTYELILKDVYYNIAMPTYLFNGGDSYDWQESNSIKLNGTDFTALIQYIKKNSPLNVSLEKRQINWQPSLRPEPPSLNLEPSSRPELDFE